MTKIDVFSGFLGAGKTTLIKKLLKEAYAGQQVVLIENEFGEIGIDGGFMKEAGIQVTEMNSGCICCSLVGDFGVALRKVLDTYHPDRILIEPSGVGKLSDVVRAASAVCDGVSCEIGALVAVVDAGKCRMYAKNFGEFFINQIEHAAAVVLTRTDIVSPEKIAAAVELVREHNPAASIITTPLAEVSGRQILDAMERKDTLAEELAKLAAEPHDDDEDEHEHHHHHHHDDDDDEDEHEHHHHHHDDDDDEDEHEHHHHHHDDDDDEDEHEHHHHHHDDDDEDDDEHEHHHGGHHHHHADEIFASWGVETPKKFGEEELREILSRLTDEASFGIVLRAKGIVPCTDGTWIHFDYTPGESEIRRGTAEVTGRLCVIGSQLKEAAVAALFGV